MWDWQLIHELKQSIYRILNVTEMYLQFRSISIPVRLMKQEST